ncbi:Glutamine amidotransferase class-I [Methanosarcina siciliae HI350]|uniref:Glutamine amidotransferase class-I n=1 Tax=Methanosarcina siciliae HI350 TaxID=1434119 RepID=A0A0E3PCZ7_9EURY|nr:type 1 glutamine amidotransferase [Methanosarcina siciliae]AKB32312.1 Glutamine amidotransferase class-I [Methanosarcina siciliae HI350]
MKIHCIRHVNFETPGTITEWIERKNHFLSTTHLYENESFPEINTFDLLIVMGGPMNIYEYEKYPWLREEKAFLEKAIAGRKAVLGICLGAQLLADILKAEVFKNDSKEIGWFPVFAERTEKAEIPLLEGIPEKFLAFHWHGDTFSLPGGAKKLFESEACKNQGFTYENRVVGLQFHLEMSNETIGNVIENCRDELVEGRYIQKEDEMLNRPDLLKESEQLMFRLLDNLEKTITY